MAGREASHLADRRVALVTGASSGLGTEFARLLAARGWDLCIAARRGDRLAKLAEEIESQHAVRVTAIENDLSSPTGAERLVAEVEASGQPISMLINNAGFGIFGQVADQSLATIDSMLQVNLVAVTKLARLCVAPMRQRGHGYVLNVASFAALQPIPGYTVYSGTKAYVVAFSQGLRHELRGSGVRVSAIAPGFTATEFHKVSRHHWTRLMKLMTLDPRQVAAAGIAGVLKGKPLIVPGWWYKANAVTVRLLPQAVASALSAWVVGPPLGQR
jgi:short-subunit dehydrogenase